MRRFMPVSALAITLASGAAFAGGNNERESGSAAQFESLDRNGDQRLSQSEAAADSNASGKFAALDIDGDGYVTKREYTAHRSKHQDEPQRQPMQPDEPRNPY